MFLYHYKLVDRITAISCGILSQVPEEFISCQPAENDKTLYYKAVAGELTELICETARDPLTAHKYTADFLRTFPLN